VVPIATPLRTHIDTLPASDQPGSPIHPKAPERPLPPLPIQLPSTSDADDVGSDLPIAGPGILQLAIVERADRPSGQAYQGESGDVAEQLGFDGKNTVPISALNRTIN
jgi:hypothetical protein